MYFMYVDESGDSGLNNSPTRYFVLTGMVLHETRWNEALAKIVAFRKRMRSKFGLLLSEEIHAGSMLSRPADLFRIKKNDRLTIIRSFIDELASMNFLNFINVRVDKQGKPAGYEPFERAWEALIQRFENTLVHQNFPRPRFANDMGVIYCDESDEAALRRLYRRMRVYNPVSSARWSFFSGYRHLPLSRIVEDPSIRRSDLSYLVQAADVAAFAAYQWYAPSKYIRQKGAKNYFVRLLPVLCTVASRTTYGVVEL
jgi:uncharacterized protein DUF3800